MIPKIITLVKSQLGFCLHTSKLWVVNSVYHGGYLRDYFLAGCSDFLKKTFDPLPKTSPTFKKKTQLSFGFCSHKKKRYNAIDAQSIYAKLS